MQIETVSGVWQLIQNDGGRDGEKRLESRYILNIKFIGYNVVSSAIIINDYIATVFQQNETLLKEK